MTPTEHRLTAANSRAQKSPTMGAGVNWPETVTSQDFLYGCALTFLARDRSSSRGACDVASPPAPADVPIGADAGGFFEENAELIKRHASLKRRYRERKGKAGCEALRERLVTATTALLMAELRHG